MIKEAQYAKTGLVLEGGAMRGMFSVGVMDVLMENKVQFDGAIGVSAGACFGYNYKSHQPGRAIRYNMQYCSDKRYCSIRSLIRTGDIYGAEFCYHEIPDKLDLFDTAAFQTSPMEFYIVCTDLITGKAVYRKMEKADAVDLDWLRASASMPLVSRIVEVEGFHLLDGGVADSIPLAYFESLGFQKNLVILTQPEGYVKKKNELLWLIRRRYRHYPNFIEAAATRHERYNQATAYAAGQERKGSCLVIRPKELLPIGHVEHDSRKLKVVYDIGRRAAQERLEEIQEFLY